MRNSNPARMASAPQEPIAHTWRVGVGQICSTESKAANREEMQKIATECAEDDANFVVFPEFSDFLSTDDQLMTQSAEPQGGEFVGFLKSLSVSLGGIAILAGFVEENGGNFFSTVAIVSSGGVSYRRKLHLYNAYGGGESNWLSAGRDHPNPTHVNGAPLIGVTICYDLRFPETTLEQRLQGAEVLVVPAAWYPGRCKNRHWDTLLRARAIENQLWTIGVGQASPLGTGSSRVFDPLGRRVIKMGRGPESSVVTLNLDLTASVREANNMDLARASRNATSA